MGISCPQNVTWSFVHAHVIATSTDTSNYIHGQKNIFYHWRIIMLFLQGRQTMIHNSLASVQPCRGHKQHTDLMPHQLASHAGACPRNELHSYEHSHQSRVQPLPSPPAPEWQQLTTASCWEAGITQCSCPARKAAEQARKNITCQIISQVFHYHYPISRCGQ